MIKEKSKKNDCFVDQEVKTVGIDVVDLDKTLSLEDIDNVDSMNNDNIVIDRDEEDRSIAEFQKTGDLKILEKVYQNRIPTLKSWANKHYYPGLIASIEDLFAELSVVFVKASEKYDSSRGNFNNCLFTFLINRIKNLKSSKYAKKRISDEYGGYLSGMILSLDYSYNSKDGSELTLKDIIPNQDTVDKNYIHKKSSFDETVNILSNNNPLFKGFLMKISEGGSLASLLKEYKTKNGKMKIDKEQGNQLSQRRNKKMVSEIIKSNQDVKGDFEVIDYSLGSDGILNYEIEMKKTKETDSIMRTIRDLRNNKDVYVEKIKGIC